MTERGTKLCIDKKTTVVHKLGDYDIWYEPCGHCGYDTGKSVKLANPRCWKCGRQISRDYSDRALRAEDVKTR